MGIKATTGRGSALLTHQLIINEAIASTNFALKAKAKGFTKKKNKQIIRPDSNASCFWYALKNLFMCKNNNIKTDYEG